MPEDKVVLTVSWEEVGVGGDPAAHLKQLALTDLTLNRGYDKDEISAVADGDTLTASCSEVARKLYLLEQKRRNHDRKHPGEPAPPVREKVSISFTRPSSRGIFNREVDVMDGG